MKWSFQNRVALWFSVATAILFVVAIVSYRSFMGLMEDARWVAHSHLVLSGLDRIEDTVTVAQDSQRGFLLTGQETYLGEFNAQIISVEQAIKDMRSLTSDNPEQQQRLATLETRINDRIQIMQRVIDLYRIQGQASAQRAIRTGAGHTAMRRVIAATQAMRDVEQQLLQRRSQRSVESTRLAISTSFVGIGFSFVILGLVYHLINQEINQRRKAEQALRESENRFMAFMDNSPVVAMIKDESLRYVYMNKMGETRFKTTLDDLRGKTDFDWLPDDVARKMAHNDQEVLDLDKPIAFLEVLPAPDGNDVSWLSFKSPFRDAVGNKYIAFMAIDVTAQKRAEADLQRYAEELARSNKELEQFAYVASHDLQEPLRMVASYTQLLSRRYKGKLDDSADEFIHYAVDGATRMQQLINDLLAYSRVSTKGKELQPVDCEVVLARALSNLRIAIEESQTEITHDPLPTVPGDDVQLGQVFQNLVSNAIKFRGEEPPRIHIAVQQRETDWMFSIRDNGIGMDPQYGERIFVLFQRLHTKTEYPGTGIGLALCKKIIERHGGYICVESQLNQGTTFFFTIPLHHSVSLVPHVPIEQSR